MCQVNKKNDHLPMHGAGPLYVCIIVVLTVAAVIFRNLPVLAGGRLTIGRVPLGILGVFLIVLGLFIWIQAVVVSKISTHIRKNELVTTGVYAWVRNPIYASFLILCTGVLMIVGNLFLFILPFLYWLFLTILMKHTEEKWLQNIYKQQYVEYCSSVNRCIPWLPKGRMRKGKKH